jgi:general secretion pathway protein M
MSAMVERLRQWLAGLSDRERNLVYAAGALAAVALLYLVLVLPFQTSGARMRARVEKKTGDLSWMQAQAPLVMAAAAAPAPGASGESLVVLVDRTAREAGLGAALRDQSPNGNAGLRLRIEAASFDTLVTWLANLQQQYGVSIDAATIDAAAPGMVNATLTLTQAAARG